MEGLKLETAAINLQNKARQEEDYLEELRLFQMQLARFIMTARMEAGVDQYDPYTAQGLDLNFLRPGDAAQGGMEMTPEQRAAWEKYRPQQNQPDTEQ